MNQDFLRIIVSIHQGLVKGRDVASCMGNLVCNVSNVRRTLVGNRLYLYRSIRARGARGTAGQRGVVHSKTEQYRPHPIH